MVGPMRSKENPSSLRNRKEEPGLQGGGPFRQLEDNFWIRPPLSKNILEKTGVPSAGLPKAGGWTT